MPLELTLTEEQLLSLKSATADADEQKSDLTLLSDVNAGSVLHNMRQRYELQEIYTSIGPQILIAVNPFEPLPVCSEEFMRELQGRESAALPPHAYTTARPAYSNPDPDPDPDPNPEPHLIPNPNPNPNPNYKP